MNLHKKNIWKTSGIHNRYKSGQLITIDNCVFRIVRGLCNEDCLICWYCNCNIYMFCNKLPINLYLKPIKNIRVKLH